MVLERIKHTKQNDKNRRSRRGEEEEKKETRQYKKAELKHKKKKEKCDWVCVCVSESVTSCFRMRCRTKNGVEVFSWYLLLAKRGTKKKKKQALKKGKCFEGVYISVSFNSNDHILSTNTWNRQNKMRKSIVKQKKKRDEEYVSDRWTAKMWNTIRNKTR